MRGQSRESRKSTRPGRVFKRDFDVYKKKPPTNVEGAVNQLNWGINFATSWCRDGGAA